MSQSHNFLITEGPSKWDLVVNFFTNASERQDVFFTLNSESPLMKKRYPGSARVALNIMAIQLESGSASRLILEGWARINGNSVTFRGYYDMKTRTGWCDLVN